MDADEQGVMLSEHLAQLRGNALRQKNGNPRPNTQEFNMWYSPEPRQKLIQFFVTEEQRIASAEEHVANSWMAPDIINLPLEFRVKIISAGIADQTGASAIAAVRCTPIGD